MEARQKNSIVGSWKTYPFKSGGPKHLSEKEYKTIMKLFMKKLAYQLITTGEEIVLPYYFGSLQAIKYKHNPSKNIVDYKKTRDRYKEYNKENPNNKKSVKINNMATNGYWCTIHWYKKRRPNGSMALFKNARNIQFSLTRPNIRPNSYNKTNPEVSLHPFFREKGWLLYKEKYRSE